MSRILVDLPEEVSAELNDRQGAEVELKLFLAEAARAWLRSKQEAETSGSAWSDGKEFAERIIARNRALFEELARLP